MEMVFPERIGIIVYIYKIIKRKIFINIFPLKEY